MLSDLSSLASHHLSNLSAGNYAPLWVPVATQLAYRWARYNLYDTISTSTPTVENINTLIQQRNGQHRLFLVLEGSQVITFFALATLNRSYLIPAGYTLFHLCWICYCKTQEKVIPGTPPQRDSMGKMIPGTPYQWDSTEGLKPFKVVR